MEERKARSKIANLESLTLGNCNITLTLDTRYKDENEKYHVSIRFTVNTARYYFHLGRSMIANPRYISDPSAHETNIYKRYTDMKRRWEK